MTTALPPGPPPPRAPVMADVARLAGVSLQTVSRVVNGAPQLRDSTRARVEEAIRQLGYRPNVAARALVTRRSRTIGVIGTKSEFWGPSRILSSLQAAAREAGFFVSTVDLAEVTHQGLAEAVDHLRGQGVEAIVMNAASDDALEVARVQETGGIPVVVVEGDLSRARLTAGVDQHAGAVMATRHLLELGHTCVAHVAGPAMWSEARERAAGWRDALVLAGVAPGPEVEGDWTATSGYAAGLALAADPDVTAVFVANDHMAIGLLHAFHEAGRRVPEDVSVVGFDDLPEAAYLIPSLTTVRQDFAAVGRLALRVLQLAVDQPTDPDGLGHESGGADDQLERLLRPELVVRRSTAPAVGPAVSPTLTPTVTPTRKAPR